jgi:hypothetical protein
MQILKSKMKTVTFALVLMIAMTSLVIIIPIINAEHDIEIDTYAYLAVAPNPIGVGQQVWVTMWLDKLPPRDVPGGPSPGGFLRFENYTLEIIKPDGTKDTMGPYQSDFVSSAYIQYTVDQQGVYSFQFIFPGNELYSVRVAGQPPTTDYYKPSSSPEVQLTVQQDPITEWPAAELPTGYW